MRSIVTVTVAAATYDLVDLATLKDELDITDTSQDARLARWITEESERIALFCDRVFPAETVRESYYMEAWPYSGRVEGLVLTRRPVISITTVSTDGAALSGTGSVVDNASVVYRVSGNAKIAWRSANCEVLYRAGYVTIPGPVQQACMTLIKHRLGARTRDPNLRSITIEGVGTKQFWVGSAGAGEEGDMPPEVEGVLKRYRDRTIA